MTRKYSRVDEAIFREIIEPIEHGDVEDARAEFDIDAIAEKVLGDYDEGFDEEKNLHIDGFNGGRGSITEDEVREYVSEYLANNGGLELLD